MSDITSEKMLDELKETPKIEGLSLDPIKFKDDKVGRTSVNIKLKEVFGFYPEEIVVRKVRGETNKIVVFAPFTPEIALKVKDGSLVVTNRGLQKPSKKDKKSGKSKDEN